jgi:hydroxyacyl-ACP dehydratase HTD2-like protein with hotdog domain
MPVTHSKLHPGVTLPPTLYSTSKVQVFRFSAATWNTHRIHYDKDYAVAEGYPDVLVQSHLHGAFLTRYCTDLVGVEGSLAALSLRVRRFAVAGDELAVTGTVTAVTPLGTERATIELDLTETRGSDGETCVTGTARVEVPLAWVTLEGIASQPHGSGEGVI